MTAPLPAGFRISPDSGTAEIAEGVLFGGSPARVLRLTAAGRRAWSLLKEQPVASSGTGVLARRLTDAGLAHPKRPETVRPATGLTIVIPVRDRAVLLDRCLGGLGGRHPVLVVDDGSNDAEAVAAVARRHGAKLVRRAVNGGPGAARDTGLRHTTGELVAFLDSDCRPYPGWVDELAWHFADPLVAAVAPRVTGGLDLGERRARVVPRTRVAFVPTAALVVRRAALLDVARGGEVFEPSMRVGEDVDLIWRLHAAGWRIRYDPSVRIGHHEPDSWLGLRVRRFRYGTSAAPLGSRHPASIPPLVLRPWPALTVGALLAGRPVLAAVVFGGSNVAMSRTLRKAGIPNKGMPRAMAGGVHQTWLATGRYAVQFAAPLLVGIIAAGRPRHRIAAASLLLGPALTACAQERPERPVRFVLAHLADDLAYGAGVWAGCYQHRTTIPLRPLVAPRPLGKET